METFKFIIGSEGQILRCARKLSANSGWKWCYFGVNIQRKEKIAGSLSASRRYRYAKELRNLAYDLKMPFVDWIARVNARYADDLQWWATNIASKSPLQSHFFLLFCYFNLIKRWVFDGKISESQLLIIVEDPYLLKLLEKEMQKDRVDSVLIKSPSIKLCIFNIAYLMKAAIIPLLFLKDMVFSSFLNGYLRHRFKSECKSSEESLSDVVICTWAEERSFGRDGKFRDFYISGLKEFYDKAGAKTGVCAQPQLSFNIKKKILSRGMKIIIMDFYLKTINWITALFQRPRYMRNENLQNFENVNYGPLFQREFLCEKASVVFYYNLCWHYAYKNYFTKNKQVKLFIYPFENQPWEKMVLFALKKYSSAAGSVGYQHSVVPPLFLNYFLGKDEHRYSPAPDCIVTNGSHYENVIRSAGFNSSKVINGGSLRYPGKRHRNLIVRKKEEGNVKNVLFLLMATFPYSAEIIYAMGDIADYGEKFKIFVKPHPDLNNEKIRRLVDSCDNAELVSVPDMDDILPDMDMVVHSGTTAALEAFYSGIPVYKINTELIDMDVFEDLKLQQYEMTVDGRINLNAAGFHTDNSCENVISEPMREDVWLSLLLGGAVKEIK